MVTKELRDLSLYKFYLTAPEMEALRNSEIHDSLIIKPSDKGGNVIVLNSPDYRHMCLSILQDPNCY